MTPKDAAMLALIRLLVQARAARVAAAVGAQVGSAPCRP
jgi:hypothetical protein